MKYLIILILILLTLGCIKKEKWGENDTISEEDIQVHEGNVTVEGNNKVRSFQMTVEKYKFVPMIIRAKKGELIRINITSLDVMHGFFQDEYEINVRIGPGETKIIEFIADKKGIFLFRSNVFSGAGYGAMRGQLIVEN